MRFSLRFASRDVFAHARLTHQAQGSCAARGEVETEDRCDPQEGDLGLVLQSGGDSGQLG